MASLSEENLNCPVCHEISKDPVVLACSHNICKACWQRWRTGRETSECPVCKTRSSSCGPPEDLALKNLSEDFLQQRTERLSVGPADLCPLHAEKLKLFCVEHQQPVCLICLFSDTHKNHDFRPVDEAAQDYREELRELVRPSREKLELFTDIKNKIDQAAEDIEVQARDTEREIEEISSVLQKCLQNEKQARITAVREEKRQKSETMKRRSEALSRDMAALSDTVGAVNEALRAEDLSFLQSYKTAAEIVQQSLPDVPQPLTGALIDMTKHLDDLPFKILDRMKNNAASTLKPKTSDQKPPVVPVGSTLSTARPTSGSTTRRIREARMPSSPEQRRGETAREKSLFTSIERLQWRPAWFVDTTPVTVTRRSLRCDSII